MTHTKGPFKAVQAFQNNGPNYWLIYQGKQTFGADPFAKCDTKEQADSIVTALNSYDAMKAALEGVVKELAPTGPIKKTYHQRVAYEAVKQALTLAEGKE